MKTKKQYGTPVTIEELKAHYKAKYLKPKQFNELADELGKTINRNNEIYIQNMQSLESSNESLSHESKKYKSALEMLKSQFKDGNNNEDGTHNGRYDWFIHLIDMVL